MALNMKTFESLITGLGVMLFVVILSLSLFYLFRPSVSDAKLSKSSTRKLPIIKSSRRDHLKKKKKLKRQPFLHSASSEDITLEPSCVTVDNETKTAKIKPLQVVPTLEEINHCNVIVNKLTSPLEAKSERIPRLLSAISDTSDSDVVSNADLTMNCKEEVNVEAIDNSSSDLISSSFALPSSIPPRHSTKVKRRLIKKTPQQSINTTNCLNLQSGSISHGYVDFDQYSKAGSVEKMLTNLSALTDMQTKMKHLVKALKKSKADLEASRQDVARAKSDNAQLHSLNDELLQNTNLLNAELCQVREKNSDLRKENSRFEEKAKSLDWTCNLLKSQLNSASVEAASERSALEKKFKGLQNHYKLALLRSRNFAISQAAQPSPEDLIRAVVFSQENETLKSSNEIIKQALLQLQETYNRQVIELQAMRNKQDALFTAKAILEDERSKAQIGLNELSDRAIVLDNQLQVYSTQLNIMRRTNQELVSAVSKLQSELTQLHEQDRRQAFIISSLKYQFLELNTEKQRLSELMLAENFSSERNTSELRACVVKLNKELAESLKTSTAQRQRADALAAELDTVKLRELLPPPYSEEVSSTSPHSESFIGVSDSTQTDGQLLLEKLTSMEKAYNESVRKFTESQNQQTLLQMTLTHTEDALAKLQLSTEKEESKWRILLALSEKQNSQLKRQLERPHSTINESGSSDSEDFILLNTAEPSEEFDEALSCCPPPPEICSSDEATAHVPPSHVVESS